MSTGFLKKFNLFSDPRWPDTLAIRSHSPGDSLSGSPSLAMSFWGYDKLPKISLEIALSSLGWPWSYFPYVLFLSLLGSLLLSSWQDHNSTFSRIFQYLFKSFLRKFVLYYMCTFFLCKYPWHCPRFSPGAYFMQLITIFGALVTFFDVLITFLSRSRTKIRVSFGRPSNLIPP